MNSRKLSRILPALVLGLCAGAVAAQQPAPGTKPAAPPAPAAPAAPAKVTPAKVSPGAPARGSELVGQKIVDASDKKLGKVEDIVVQDSGEVTAVVERESGGLVCVPMSALQPKLKKQDADKEGTPTAEVEDFLFTADAAQLAAAATITNAEAVDATALDRCREYFAGKTAASRTEPAAKPQEGKGTDKPAMTSVTKPWCVKKLVGTNLKDSAGEGLGEVKDVAVDLGRGQVAYVVISTGGVMGVGDKLHGVALGRLIRTADGKDLALPMTKDSLKALKGFDIDHLPMTPDISVGATGDLVTPSSTDSNS
jgi:sporulation protein YlmC with PRC-barrel domain